MKVAKSKIAGFTICALSALLLASAAWGQGMTKGMMSPPANMRPPGLAQVGITQKLDTQLPLDLTFRDETGASVQSISKDLRAFVESRSGYGHVSPLTIDANRRRIGS